MKIRPRALVFGGAVCCLLLFAPRAPRSQEFPRTYLFLEVKTTPGRPCDRALVKLLEEAERRH